MKQNLTAVTFTLPVPPSVNHYWRHTSQGVFITAEAAKYRRDVAVCCLQIRRFFPIAGRLKVTVEFHAPDNKRRDLDNVFKALLDAMQHVGVYDDDSQIDQLGITRGDPMPRGELVVKVEVIR